MNGKEKQNVSWEEARVNRSLSQGKDLEWMIHVATWPSTTSALLETFNPSGSSTKMSLACCHLEEGQISLPSSAKWQNSGMGSPTEFLTLKISESHSEDEGCLLSDVLMGIGEVPPQYYLSPRASFGILNRADRRGKKIPSLLRTALEIRAKIHRATLEEE